MTPSELKPAFVKYLRATYAGFWVAIVDNEEVLAAGASLSSLLETVRPLGFSCDITYVEHPGEGDRWGLRYPPSPRIGPNDQFPTREQAERWARSWLHLRGPWVLMERVDGGTLHGTWQEVETGHVH